MTELRVQPFINVWNQKSFTLDLGSLPCLDLLGGFYLDVFERQRFTDLHVFTMQESRGWIQG